MPTKQRSEYGTGSVRKRGQSWIGRFYDEDGERVEPNLGKIKDIGDSPVKARKVLRRFMAVYEKPKKTDDITMDVLCDKYVLHREADPDLEPSSLASIKSYVRVHIKPAFENRPAAGLTREDLERFQTEKLKTYAPSSVKHYMSTIHSALEFGVKTLKVLPTNVAKEVKGIKARGSLDLTVLATEEIKRLCAAAQEVDETFGEQDAVMILTAARSGLRQGELVSVRVRNLDFDNGWIRIVTSYDRVSKEHKRPKGQTGRALPMSEEVKAALRAHVDRLGLAGNDLVFAHPETRHELDGSALLKRFKAAVIWAGVRREEWEKRTYRTSRGRSKQRWYTPIRFHDLRHAFGTWSAASGIPAHSIEEWCGWADKKTMKLYLHYSPAGFELDLLNKAAARDPLFVPNLTPNLAIATPVAA